MLTGDGREAERLRLFSKAPDVLAARGPVHAAMCIPHKQPATGPHSQYSKHKHC